MFYYFLVVKREPIAKFAGISWKKGTLIEIGVLWEFLFVSMFKEYFKLFEWRTMFIEQIITNTFWSMFLVNVKK